MKIHVCGWLSFDKVCREVGCPRIGITTKRWHVDIAITPGSRFADPQTKWEALNVEPRWRWIVISRLADA